MPLEQKPWPTRQIASLILLLFGVCQLVAQERASSPDSESTLAAYRSEIEALKHRLSLLEAGNPPSSSSVIPMPPDPVAPRFRLARWLDSVTPERSSLELGGYVKLDLIHDFDAIATTDVFDPLSIPTDGRPGENTRLHARQTRMNLDFRPDSRCDDLRLFVEGDFFGSTDPFRRARAFFRLRHAFIRVGPLLAGQTWSTFMDESILPSTLDFESPRSVILDRRAILRWTQPIGNSLKFSLAVEDPRPLFDLNSAPAGDVERPAPDLITRFRFERPDWHLQSAGVVRLLRYRTAAGVKDDATGWGFNFTGRCRHFENHSCLFQVAFGEGIEGYRQTFDAAVDATGNLDVIPVIAWIAGYEVDWSNRFSSTVVYGAGRADNTDFQLANAPEAAEYLAANLIYRPMTRLSYGVEYLYGTRTDNDGSQGEAHRMQFSVRYDLP